MLTGHDAAKAQADYAPLAASACCEGLPASYAIENGESDIKADYMQSVSCISSNPKDIAARGKCPLWLVPPVAEHIEARVLEHGAAKYGPYNWRREAIQLSNYLSAIRRHLGAYIDGEDIDPESGLNHLAHARATLGIILDAQMHGKVIDDRPMK